MTFAETRGVAPRLDRLPGLSGPGKSFGLAVGTGSGSKPEVVASSYGRLPLHFEPNLGQTDGQVRFLARGGGMTAFFTDTETVMVLGRSEQTVVRMKLEKAGKPRRIAGLEKLPGISNYFIGNDPAKWRTDVPHFARIKQEGVYPGIDLVWYGNERRLEYDFIVAPGADPKQIQVAYEGVESLGVEAGGDLVLRTALGEMRQQKPRVYQEIGGKQVEVAARYAILARNQVTFELAKYDRKRQLRIDPVVLVYSTYLGGSAADDYGFGIAVDGAGSAYVTGWIFSTNFPTQSAYQATYGGNGDAFVTKLTPAGNALVYSTYLGGSGSDRAIGIAVDGAGSAYVTGLTSSTDFPTQSAYQATFRGGPWDAFVTKLTPAGNALAYSTYLGGSGDDEGLGIAVDRGGSAYVTGQTQSNNFPTQSAYQATFRGGPWDAFVTKLMPEGNALVYSTYLGGSGSDGGGGISVDAVGSAYVTGSTNSTNLPSQATYGGGSDAFVTKLTPEGNALVYSTYLGGSNTDQGYGIAVDGAGSAYVTGNTASRNFPTKSAYQATFQGGTWDAFVTKLTPEGNALVYSTYLGGSGDEVFLAIAVDGAGSAYVTGRTFSTNFPTQSAYQATFQGGTCDAFVTKLTREGNALVYSTYLGGSGDDTSRRIAVDGAGSAYVTGYTSSTNFPTQSAYQATFQDGSWDAFVTKLALPAPTLVLSSATMTFQAAEGGAAPASQNLLVSNASGSAYSWTAQATTIAGGNWLQLGQTSGNRDSALSVSVNPAGLKLGRYQGSVVVTAPGLAASPQSVQVTFTVTAPPTLAVAASALTFQAITGQNAPPQNLTITNTGGGTLNWTAAASVSGGGSWLRVSPTSGTGNGSVQVTTSSASLSPGSYSGTITINAVGAVNSPVAVPVTLTLRVPPPTIFSGGVAGAGGSIPAVLQISIGGFATIYGLNFAPDGTLRRVESEDLVNGNLPTKLAGVCVQVGSARGFVTLVTPGQINFQVPGLFSDPVNVQVVTNCEETTEVRSSARSVPRKVATPEFLYWVANANGINPVVAVNAVTGAYIGAPGLIPGLTFTPAKSGDILTIYGISFGPTNPPFTAGRPPTRIGAVTNAPSVGFGTLFLSPADILYAGVSPGTAGLYQLSIRIPSDLPDGNYSLVLGLGDLFKTPAGGFVTVKN